MTTAKKNKKGVIGILTGGGDVPGLNPAIRAVTIRANREGYKVIGLRRGWAGITELVRDKKADNSASYLVLTDDIVDTGKSMQETIKYLESFNPKDVKSSVMQYLTCSKYEPNYYADKEECWTWFVYPWNVVEDSCNLITKLLNSEGALSSDKILTKMKDNYNLDFTKDQINEYLKELSTRNKISQVKNEWKLN